MSTAVTHINNQWLEQPKITLDEMWTTSLLHELGHVLGILKRNPNPNEPIEWYCDEAPAAEGFGNDWCAMAHASGESARHQDYCIAHWQMLNIAGGISNQ
jgi:hypothetical protein